MSEKSFGIKELNLMSASGTPTIESPNDIVFKSGGSNERVRITSGGNMGVGGLASPGALLSIPAGESNTPRFAIESAVDANDFTITQYEDGNGTYTMLGQNVKLNSSGNNTILDSAHRTAAIQLDARNNGNVTFYTGAANAVGERLRITSDGDVLLSGLTTKNDGRNDKGISLKSASGISFQNFGSNGSRNWRIRPDDLTSWGSLEFSVSPTDNNNTDWPDAADDVVLELKKDKDVVVSNGNLVIGTSGNGIDFSANSNASGMASELLDDYEEGTFTPTVTVEGQSAATTDKQYGRYIKVGNKVTVWCYVQLNGTPSGRATNAAWQHGGLPFSQRNTAGGFDVGGPILYWTIDSTAALNGTAPYHLQARLFNNSSGGRIRGTDSSNNQNGQNLSLLLKDNTEYSYTFTYEVG